MKPRPRLGLGLAESATDPVALGVPALPAAPAAEDVPAPEAPASAPKKAKKYDRASTRVGTRGVTVWLEPDGFRALKMLSAEKDKTVQDLMTEAVNLLFRKYDKARVLKS